jgi:uncharacterized repeat protein (TIGR01451 family)
MITRTLKRLRTALVAVAALGSWMGANAQMTTAGTSINNRATVNYSVGGLAQAPIESSPTGNTTPGVGGGASTSFLVDNLINLSVSELSGSATVVTPGQTNQVLSFTVANSGNSPEGYQLTVSEEVGTLLFGNTDNANFGLANLVVRVDEDPSAGNGTGNDIYDGTESATAINVLNPGQSVTVFVLATPTVPLTVINGNYANVALQARAAAPGSNGATLEVESAGANLPTTVEILFADAGRDATQAATDQFSVVSAALTITKVQTVIDDGFGSASPRAIPGATVVYLTTIQNTSPTVPATAVSFSDPIPTNTTLLPDQYSATGDVGITGGAVATCNADANDADADGCGIVAGSLNVSAAVLGNVAALGQVQVAFQVKIN